MDDPNQPLEEEEQPPTNAAEGEETVPATQFSQEDENEENEDGSPPQNNNVGAPTEQQETPNNPRIFATPGKPPNQQRDNLEDINMNEEDEEMVAETPHFNRNQQGKYNYYYCVLP